MNEKYNIKDKHEIASIINHCLDDGYCDASMLARRIVQAGYGNGNRIRKEFAKKCKARINADYVNGMLNNHRGCLTEYDIDELVKEFE